MELEIVIHQPEPPPPSQTPNGYQKRFVRKWYDPIMVQQGNYSLEQRFPAGQITGTFAIVTPYIPEAGGWSSISNYFVLTHEHLIKIARAQLAAFEVPHWDPIKDMDKPLLDGWTLKQKMAWIYQANWQTGTKPGLTMWGAGEWWEPGQKRYGAMVNAGEPLFVSNDTIDLLCTLPNDKVDRWRKMRSIYVFKAADLTLDPIENPCLWQNATCSYLNRPHSINTPKGNIKLPICPSADDFPFRNNIRPSGYYIPDDWLEK